MLAETLFQFADCHLAQRLYRSVSQHYRCFNDMLPRATVDQRVGAARVVAEHPADATAVARRCLRTEEESVWAQRYVQLVAHHTWLHAGPPFLGVDFEDVVPVPADVHNDTAAHHLSGYARAGGSWDEVSTAFLCHPQQRADVVDCLRVGHGLRYLPVHAGVRAIGYLMQTVGKYLHAVFL